MAENTNIPWAHHSHNEWLGCEHKSPGCKHCYAEALVDGRFHLNVWGPPRSTPRHLTTKANRRKPFRYERRCAASGVRERVFSASLSDVFEDHPALPPWRAGLFATIEATPHLDWLLVTKRPENLRAMLPAAWLARPRHNVWLLATAEDQKHLDERAPLLLDVPAVVHGLSIEPQLEGVDLSYWLADTRTMCRCGWQPYGGMVKWRELHGPDATCIQCGARVLGSRVDWAIVGGESGGPAARPFQLAWARRVVAQCREAGTVPFVKQLGSRATAATSAALAHDPNYQLTLRHRAGADPAEWPADLNVREFPTPRDPFGLTGSVAA